MEQVLLYIIYPAKQSAVVAMEVAKRSLIGQKCKRTCAVGLFTQSFRLCSPVSPAIFIFDSLKNCTMASKEAYLATELDRARGCNLKDSNLTAVIGDYFEGRVEPVEVASAGAEEDHIDPALVGSAPTGADFPNWGN